MPCAEPDDGSHQPDVPDVTRRDALALRKGRGTGIVWVLIGVAASELKAVPSERLR
jgi:hypothetical protein